MKKVFIVHGFEGHPNGGWRPWLMGELEKIDIYACALSMVSPEKPVCADWVEEISWIVDKNKEDDIYLVGHSLGVPAILRFLEETKNKVKGAVLVSGPMHFRNKNIDEKFYKTFDFKKIKSKCKNFVVIHGDNDAFVALEDAESFSKELNGDLIIVKNGGHLNGGAGWFQLPQCLEALIKMLK